MLEQRLCRLTNRKLVSIATFLLLLSVLSSGLPPLPSAVFATTTLNISDNSGASADPAIAVFGNELFVAWKDDGAASADIFLTSSLAGYTSQVNLSDNSGESTNPDIAISSAGDVYVAWTQDTDIFLANSTDNYATPINISNGVGTSSSPRIAISSAGDVYVAWTQDTDIFLANSTDNYATPINISNNVGESVELDITSPNNDVYVVWRDDGLTSTDIFLANSTDNYATPINISNNEGASRFPSITSSDDNVYIVWQDDGPEGPGTSDVYLAESTDGFDSQTNVSNNIPLSFNPDLAVLNGDVYVVWTDIDDVLINVYSARRLSGEDFGSPINVSQIPGGSTVQPIARIAIPETGNVAIVWNGDGPDSSDIFLAQDISYILPTITITDEGNLSPKWNIDEVLIQGTVDNFDFGDTVSVDWGDGSLSEGISIEDGSWSASHPYESFAILSNPVMVFASVVGPDFSIKATSDPISKTVQRHDTALSLGPVASVIGGSAIDVTGKLIDSDTGDGIQDATIWFEGTGVIDLSPVTTSAEGLFEVSGTSPSGIEDLLTVRAHFDGDDLYADSSSESRTYDTVDAEATTFPVSAGSEIHVDVTGFGTSIDFEEVTTSGELFVTPCDTPANPRYISMDQCLRLSSGFAMASGSDAHIEVSYDIAEIPGGHTEDEVSIFHEGLLGMVDITESRDIGSNTVTGIISGFSNFIVAIPVHEAQPDHSVRKQMYVGDGSEVVLRDMEIPESIDAEISLDRSLYELSDTAFLTIIDHDANLDPAAIDVIEANVSTDTSGPDGGISIILAEDLIHPGVFTGAFTFTSSLSSGSSLQASPGDNISVSYDQDFGARSEVSFEGVEEAGASQLQDVDNIGDPTSLPFDPVGYAVELKFLDSSLTSKGNITLTLSYTNGLFKEDALRERLDIYHGIRVDNDNIDWTATAITPIDPDNGYTIGVNTDSETVTVKTISPGIFMLGYSVGEPGGGGGGLPRPGTGIVLDAVASIGRGSTNDGNSRDGGGGSHRVVVVTNQPVSLTAPTIDIKSESYFVEHPLERIQFSYAGFTDPAGSDVTDARVGHQVIIGSSFSNYQQLSQHYSFIVAIIDEDGVAIDIDWQQGSIESGQMAGMSTSWTPQDVGKYTIKIFIWDGMDLPSPLCDLMTRSINVG